MLYIGGSTKHFDCGSKFHDVGHEITLLEIWPVYANAMSTSERVQHVVIGDVRLVDTLRLPHTTYDYVVWLNGPEHIPPYDFEATMTKLETLTDRVILLASPWGHMEWPAEDGNPHMRHQSHWYPEDYERLGYRYVAVWPVDRAGGFLMAWKAMHVIKRMES